MTDPLANHTGAYWRAVTVYGVFECCLLAGIYILLRTLSVLTKKLPALYASGLSVFKGVRCFHLMQVFFLSFRLAKMRRAKSGFALILYSNSQHGPQSPVRGIRVGLPHKRHGIVSGLFTVFCPLVEPSGSNSAPKFTAGSLANRIRAGPAGLNFAFAEIGLEPMPDATCQDSTGSISVLSGEVLASRVINAHLVPSLDKLKAAGVCGARVLQHFRRYRVAPFDKPKQGASVPTMAQNRFVISHERLMRTAVISPLNPASLVDKDAKRVAHRLLV